jgi:hypothetical protein
MIIFRKCNHFYDLSKNKKQTKLTTLYSRNYIHIIFTYTYIVKMRCKGA